MALNLLTHTRLRPALQDYQDNGNAHGGIYYGSQVGVGPSSCRTLTENALQLTRGVYLCQTGRLGWHGLYRLLASIEERLLSHVEGNVQTALDNGDAGGLLGRTHEALEDSLQALDHMRMAWDTADDSCLQTGLSQFHDASDELLRTLERLKAWPLDSCGGWAGAPGKGN